MTFNLSTQDCVQRLGLCVAQATSKLLGDDSREHRPRLPQLLPPRPVKIAHDPRLSCACPSRHNPAFSSRFTNRVWPHRLV
jgi:hypothetical protein